MKKYVLIVLIVALGVTVSARAQERWMADQVGSLGLHTKAPSYSAGVEVSYSLINAGAFHLGPGAGILFSRPYFYDEGEMSPMRFHQRALSMPLFVRGELGLGPDSARYFILLDVGYQFSLAEKLNNQNYREYMTRLDILGGYAMRSLGCFITPQFGINFGRHFYAAAGIWCQWVRGCGVELDGKVYEDHTGKYQPTVSASLRLGVRF